MAAIKIWYDSDGDYLEILFDDVPASLEEIEDDVFERRTPEGRIVGISVFNFSLHDRERLTLPLDVRVRDES